MQGFFRYLLAHLVVVGHLWREVWTQPQVHPGVYAVFAFYLLSGYLMSLTLDRTYAATLRGRCRFFVNRALRIYPPYWAALVVTVLLLTVGGVDPYRINPFVQLPQTVQELAANLGIFGLGGGPLSAELATRRLVPQGWSLHVELCFYLAMGVLLGRRPWVPIVWFLVSVVGTLLWVSEGASWQLRYIPVAAASLPFSLGALLYHARAPLEEAIEAMDLAVTRRAAVRGSRVRGARALLLGTVFVVHALVADRVWRDPMAAGFYVSLALAALVLLSVNALRTEDVPERWVAIDRFLGKLSYPIFLCHWVPALALAPVAFEGRNPGGMTLLLLALIPVNALGAAIHLTVEAPLERLRGRVRAEGSG